MCLPPGHTVSWDLDMAISPLRGFDPAEISRRSQANADGGQQVFNAPNNRVDVFSSEKTFGVAPSALPDPALAPAGAPTNPPAPLTAEEQRYVDQGLLPQNYGLLKANPEWAIASAKEAAGTTGPFGWGFGDPAAMLRGAQSIDAAGMTAFVQTIQPGDIVEVDYKNPNGMVERAQDGATFGHTLICVAKGPPAQFVEAEQKVTLSDMSCLCAASDANGNPAPTNKLFRVLRPTYGMDPATAQSAIDQAVTFARAQVGKNYDYTYGDQPSSGVPDRFYCSELAYDAYSMTSGLKLGLNKSPDRDANAIAYHDLLHDLKVTDEQGMAQSVYDDMKASPDLGAALVKDILPKSAAFAQVVKDPRYNPAQLRQDIDDCISGKAFADFKNAKAEYDHLKATGGFNDTKGPFGIPIPGTGWIKEKIAMTRVVLALADDVKNVVTHSGLPWDAAGPVKDLLFTIIPHLDSLAGFAFGNNSAQKKDANQILDLIDTVRSWPVAGPILNGLNIPHRAPRVTLPSLIGPTDEAWGGTAWQDFGAGVNPETPWTNDPMLDPNNPLNGYVDLWASMQNS